MFTPAPQGSIPPVLRASSWHIQIPNRDYMVLWIEDCARTQVRDVGDMIVCLGSMGQTTHHNMDRKILQWLWLFQPWTGRPSASLSTKTNKVSCFWAAGGSKWIEIPFVAVLSLDYPIYPAAFAEKMTKANGNGDRSISDFLLVSFSRLRLHQLTRPSRRYGFVTVSYFLALTLGKCDELQLLPFVHLIKPLITPPQCRHNRRYGKRSPPILLT